ncbi:MAG: DMT family transporter [Thermoleophilaceae bacterium]
MDRWLPLLATIGAGGVVALQAPVNSALGKAVGTFAAASFTFATGALVLVAIALLFGGGFGEISNVGHLSWYYLTGGILGAAYVTTVLVTVRSLGAGGVTAATIAGQLTISVLIDRAGYLGIDERALTPGRLLGMVLLVAGTFLIVSSE